MFSHIMLGTNNLSESIKFYDQVMPILGFPRGSTGEKFAGYGEKEDISTGFNCLWIGVPFNEEPAKQGKLRQQIEKLFSLLYTKLRICFRLLKKK